MLTISNPLKGLDSVNYYLSEGAEPGFWHGSGTELMGLQGPVAPLDLRLLWAGYSPKTAEELVRNAGYHDRCSAWDLTFSDPKSVGVLRGVGSPEVKMAVDRSRQGALTETLDWIESKGGFCRRGAAGSMAEPAGLIFAVFDHHMSRQMEPATHFHVLLLNVGVRPDRTTGAVETGGIFELKMKAGEYFRNALERRLCAELQIETVPQTFGFRITQVPDALCERFSTRRKEIVAAMEKRGVFGAVAAKVAALATRRPKERVSEAEIADSWMKVAESFGWNPDHVQVRRTQDRAKSEEAVQDAAPKERENGDSLRPLGVEKREGPQKEAGSERFSGRSREEESRRGGAKREQSETNGSGGGQSAKEGAQQGSGGPGERTRANRRERRPRRKESFFRIEMRYVAPNAPRWSPFYNWRLPVIVIGRARPCWGKVRYRRDIGNLVFSVQQRRLFPHAPGWNPLSLISLPAVRIRTRRGMLKEAREWRRRNVGESFADWRERTGRRENLRNRRERSSERKSQSAANSH